MYFEAQKKLCHRSVPKKLCHRSVPSHAYCSFLLRQALGDGFAAWFNLKTSTFYAAKSLPPTVVLANAKVMKNIY
jgi:hypothetical protein